MSNVTGAVTQQRHLMIKHIALYFFRSDDCLAIYKGKRKFTKSYPNIAILNLIIPHLTET